MKWTKKNLKWLNLRNLTFHPFNVSRTICELCIYRLPLSSVLLLTMRRQCAHHCIALHRVEDEYLPRCAIFISPLTPIAAHTHRQCQINIYTKRLLHLPSILFLLFSLFLSLSREFCLFPLIKNRTKRVFGIRDRVSVTSIFAISFGGTGTMAT